MLPGSEGRGMRTHRERAIYVEGIVLGMMLAVLLFVLVQWLQPARPDVPEMPPTSTAPPY